MSSAAGVVVYLILLTLFVVPIRVAAWWFDAKRKSWLASFMVLIIGAALVNAALHTVPAKWIENTYGRFAIVFSILAVVSCLGLEMKLWQAALLSFFMTLAYWFAV